MIFALSVKTIVLQLAIEPVTSNDLNVIVLATTLSLDNEMIILPVVAVAVNESSFTPERLKTYFTPTIMLLRLTVAFALLEHTIGSENEGKPALRSGLIVTKALSLKTAELQAAMELVTSRILTETVFETGLNFESAIDNVAVVPVAVTESIFKPARLNTYLTPAIVLFKVTDAEPALEQSVGSLNVGRPGSMIGLIVIIDLSEKTVLAHILIEPVTSRVLWVTVFNTGLNFETVIERLADVPVAVTESILTPPKLNTYLTPAIELLIMTVADGSFEQTVGSEKAGNPGSSSGFMVITDLSA